jgi:signal transduction histidine kinase
MRKELIVAAVIYFVTMFTLLLSLYRFFENWHLSEFNFFIAGALVLLVAIGWGYVLTALIFAPKKQMENTLTTLTNDIIHELNIPLATIQANTSMLRKNVEDDKTLKRLERIDNASARLKKLYDELVYSIHKEMHSIEKEHVDLAVLLKERIAIFEEQQRNTFLVHVEKYEIEVDKIGFEQMFDNLITNAMKYSKKASDIHVVLENNILKIVDNGIGMTTSELLRVHERYFQVNEEKEGTGLGLSLVKRYCDSQSIEIHISSEKGLGTTIALNLMNVRL